jgi:hypothetical protein
MKSVSDSDDRVAFFKFVTFFILFRFFVINQFWTTEKLILDDK